MSHYNTLSSAIRSINLIMPILIGRWMCPAVPAAVNTTSRHHPLNQTSLHRENSGIQGRVVRLSASGAYSAWLACAICLWTPVLALDTSVFRSVFSSPPHSLFNTNLHAMWLQELGLAKLHTRSSRAPWGFVTLLTMLACVSTKHQCFRPVHLATHCSRLTRLSFVRTLRDHMTRWLRRKY